MRETTLRPLEPMRALPALVEDERDAPLGEGEIVVRPLGSAPRLALFFASVWEPFLLLDGKRLLAHEERRHRRTFTWLGRHLPVLHRALESERVLFAELTEAGVVVVDVASLDEEGAFLDHAAVRRMLGSQLPMFAPFALLGPISSKNDLMGRLRAMYATGSRVEVRREDGGKVIGRRMVQVGRGE